jgi:hypothetical protein
VARQAQKRLSYSALACQPVRRRSIMTSTREGECRKTVTRIQKQQLGVFSVAYSSFFMVTGCYLCNPAAEKIDERQCR